jgi:hypothetical protein
VLFGNDADLQGTSREFRIGSAPVRISHYNSIQAVALRGFTQPDRIHVIHPGNAFEKVIDLGNMDASP